MPSSRSEGLAGAVALVTGAGGGIGLAVVTALVSAGATVFAGHRGEAPSRSTAGVRWIDLDVALSASRARALSEIVAVHGRLDVLVNSAGVLHLAPLEELSEAALRESMEVNFFGPMLLSRAAIPLMRHAGRGAIVMLSSLSGLVGLPTESAYAASKFALEGAAEALHHEVKPFGISVMLVEPGGVATEFAPRPAAAASGESPYGSLVQLRGAAASAGMPALEVAAAIVHALQGGAVPLRLPAGAQAQAVVARLQTLSAGERASLVRDVAQLERWEATLSAPHREVK
jgi:NAD(P)-dependent dehydrogenase (short-subunit alcohol dehydrogenase family)